MAPSYSSSLSSHLGGTAMNLNWSDHPMGKAYDGFTSAEIAAVRELLTS
ncbi:hypothetical protein [Mycobacteroides abscessus]|nr:hypothetical protein [Mycobacteroides abscessus]